MSILGTEGIESYSVVQDRLDDCVLGDQLITEHDLTGGVIEAAHTKLANLNTTLFQYSVGNTFATKAFVPKFHPNLTTQFPTLMKPLYVILQGFLTQI